MPAAVRPYVTAGVALVGASVIAVTPIAPSELQSRSADLAVRLAAASIANVPVNLFNAIANTPYNLLQALGNGNVTLGEDSTFSFNPGYQGVTLNQAPGNVVGLTATFNYGGNWWVYHPTNVLGTDPGDVPRYQALVNVLVPMPALSVPLGNLVAAIVASQLPMNVGCTGTGVGACNDPIAILSTMFDLRHIAALFSPQGYTFPTVRDPIVCDSSGTCDISDPNGPELPWSGQNVKLDPFAPFTSFFNSLMEDPDPAGIHSVTPEMFVQTFVGLATAIFNAFNPFVPGTQCGLCAMFVPPLSMSTTIAPPAESPQMVTMNLAGLSAGDVLKKMNDLGEEQESLTAEQDGLAVDGVDGTATNAARVLGKASPTVTPDPAAVFDPVSLSVAPDADQGLGTPTPAVDATRVVEKPEPTTATSTTAILDGNKFVPAQSGPKHRKPSGGGLADAMQSVRDTFSKITEGLKGGDTNGDTAKAGEANTGSEGGSANASN